MFPNIPFAVTDAMVDGVKCIPVPGTVDPDVRYQAIADWYQKHFPTPEQWNCVWITLAVRTAISRQQQNRILKELGRLGVFVKRYLEVLPQIDPEGIGNADVAVTAESVFVRMNPGAREIMLTGLNMAFTGWAALPGQQLAWKLFSIGTYTTMMPGALSLASLDRIVRCEAYMSSFRHSALSVITRQQDYFAFKITLAQLDEYARVLDLRAQCPLKYWVQIVNVDPTNHQVNLDMLARISDEISADYVTVMAACDHITQIMVNFPPDTTSLLATGGMYALHQVYMQACTGIQKVIGKAITQIAREHIFFSVLGQKEIIWCGYRRLIDDAEQQEAAMLMEKVIEPKLME